MEVLKYLINDVRVKPLAREKINGMTTIHAASTANQLQVVKVTQCLWCIIIICIPNTVACGQIG